MAKQYGDVVEYVRNGIVLNALVAQTTEQADGEHLTVVYLDPALASGLMSGAAVDHALAKAFVTPLVEGGLNGWKEVGAEVDHATINVIPARPGIHIGKDANEDGLAPVVAPLVEVQPLLKSSGIDGDAGDWTKHGDGTGYPDEPVIEPVVTEPVVETAPIVEPAPVVEGVEPAPIGEEPAPLV